MIAWENISAFDAVSQGRDTTLLSTEEFWTDFILEVKPIGSDSFEIVWEWHAMDHLVQDFDSNQANYGVVYDHPELIDINYGSLSINNSKVKHLTIVKQADKINRHGVKDRWLLYVHHMSAVRNHY